MSETIISALIGAGVTLFTVVVTTITNACIESKKRKMDMRQKIYESKRENLNDIYEKLISVVNAYPNASPNDIMKDMKYPLNYCMESFDTVISILKSQIDDFSRKLENENISCIEINELKVDISNNKHGIKKIEQIRDEYFDACNKYREFCKKDKIILDLYAGQNVKNMLVEFDVIIHNVFVSGRSAGDIYDPTKNLIDKTRDKIIKCMRIDIGID